MAIKGSLKEASLADVCQLLAHGSKTGCLSVTDRSRFGQVFFERGAITYATIVNRRDRLGDLLVRDGVLDAKHLQEVVQAQGKEPDRRLGELLVERGLLSTAMLERYIRLQIEEAVYFLFTWSRGTFFFEVGQRAPAGAFTVSFSPEALLLECARRIDEWEQIQNKITSLDLLFQVDSGRLRDARVTLTPKQEQLLPFLDGTRSVQEIIEETGLLEFDVGSALYGLILAGFAEQVGRRRGDPPTRESAAAEHRNLGIAFYRAGLLPDASHEFHRVVELLPEDLVARFHLALLMLREGRNAEAAAGFRRLLDVSDPRFAIFVNLAVALTRLSRFQDALLVLDEAEALQPGKPMVALQRAGIRLALGQLAECTSELADYRARLRADDVASPVFFHHAGLCAALAGDLETARDLLQEGVETYPASAPLFLLAGAVAERRGEPHLAERFYRVGAEEAPMLALAHKNLGDLAYRRGLFEEAEEYYVRAIELEPDLGDEVFARLGNIRFKRGERDDALDCWRRALELNPRNELARTSLETASEAAGPAGGPAAVPE